jgi:hypothetical protein
MNKEEKIIEYTKQLIEGGWTSVYQFVLDHIEDWELEDDEDDNDNNENED